MRWIAIAAIVGSIVLLVMGLWPFALLLIAVCVWLAELVFEAEHEMICPICQGQHGVSGGFHG